MTMFDISYEIQFYSILLYYILEGDGPFNVGYGELKLNVHPLILKVGLS